jgi:hypothetical protein
LNESGINSYRDLRAWQEAMALAEACYKLTRGFPKEEMFGLTSQIRRSAGSIPAQALRIAQGSLKEVETHLMLATRVGVISQEKIESPMAQCGAIGKMLRSLIRSLQQKNS